MLGPMAFAKSIELDIPWMHLPVDELPYTSVEFMVAAGAVYLAIITVGSALMKGRKVCSVFVLLVTMI